jgi:hypothetical protein
VTWIFDLKILDRSKPHLERASKSRTSRRRIVDLHAYLDAYAYTPFPADQDAPANLGARFIYAARARSVKLKSRLQPRNKESVACTTQQVEVAATSSQILVDPAVISKLAIRELGFP